MSKSIRIASYPSRDDTSNPYVDLFYAALAPHGIELVGELKMDFDWLTEHYGRIDGVHFHWPEHLWRWFIPPNNSRIHHFLHNKVAGLWRVFQYLNYLKTLPKFKKIIHPINKLKGILEFRKFLKLCKKNGIRIIWTLHNIESHERNDWIDKLGYHYLSKATDLVIFHSETSKNEYFERYHINGQLVVMPHGNYDNFYPTPRPKNIVLAELGLRDDLPIVSCLGMLRNYKGLNVATEAISLLGDEVQFLCAGKSHPSFDLVSLQNNIMKLTNALLIPRFINNQEFADYVSISNLVLMPYNRITGSGALLAVLTLGRGVVASDLPYFREILGNNSDAGMLVASEDPIAFAENIRKYLIIPANKSNQAARFLAERYEWSKVVPPVVEVIKNWGEFSSTS